MSWVSTVSSLIKAWTRWIWCSFCISLKTNFATWRNDDALSGVVIWNWGRHHSVVKWVRAPPANPDEMNNRHQFRSQGVLRFWQSLRCSASKVAFYFWIRKLSHLRNLDLTNMTLALTWNAHSDAVTFPKPWDHSHIIKTATRQKLSRCKVVVLKITVVEENNTAGLKKQYIQSYSTVW